MNAQQLKCSDCTVNPAEYELKNGEEVSVLCGPCFKDVLLDLAKGNDWLILHQTSKGKWELR